MTKIHLEHTDSEGNAFYSCNLAVAANPLSMSSNIESITCKNCKRILEKSSQEKCIVCKKLIPINIPSIKYCSKHCYNEDNR